MSLTAAFYLIAIFALAIDDTKLCSRIDITLPTRSQSSLQ